jgi:hypothetical protein
MLNPDLQLAKDIDRHLKREEPVAEKQIPDADIFMLEVTHPLPYIEPFQYWDTKEELKKIKPSLENLGYECRIV